MGRNRLESGGSSPAILWAERTFYAPDVGGLRNLPPGLATRPWLTASAGRGGVIPPWATGGETGKSSLQAGADIAIADRGPDRPHGWAHGEHGSPDTGGGSASGHGRLRSLNTPETAKRLPPLSWPQQQRKRRCPSCGKLYVGRPRQEPVCLTCNIRERAARDEHPAAIAVRFGIPRFLVERPRSLSDANLGRPPGRESRGGASRIVRGSIRARPRTIPPYRVIATRERIMRLGIGGRYFRDWWTVLWWARQPPAVSSRDAGMFTRSLFPYAAQNRPEALTTSPAGCALDPRRCSMSMATEKCTLVAIEKCTLFGSPRRGSVATRAGAPDGVRTPIMTLLPRSRRAPRRRRGRLLGGWPWRVPCGVASGSCCPGC